MTRVSKPAMEHEFCPRCEANLTLQKGYDPSLPFWVCLGCGEMLINPEVETNTDIAWICDGCGHMLNIQKGFREDCGNWTCTECGFVNKIGQSELYTTEDEYRADLKNPYRGLSDEDALELTMYEAEERIAGREDILLVRDRESGKRYVKKLLTTYNRSIYDHLKEHSVHNMPQIIGVFEGDNCLIVIEEYIEGKTIEELLVNGTLSEGEAIRIAESICRILMELHKPPMTIVHRDIKPSNVILTPDGQVYLLDMNVAKWYDADQADDTRYMGTQHYAAPEQVGYGFSASSAKSDIYALGVLLNVMITGRFPKEEPADGTIWEVIMRCISLNAEDRYTAEELLEELEKL